MYQIFYFIKYFLLKEDRHSIQSPFTYKVYNDLLAHKNRGGDQKIEKLRNDFLKNENILTIQDLGAGSHKLKASTRKIKEISKFSNSSIKYNLLYQYFLSLTPTDTCLELGTGNGINAQYLAQIVSGKLYTIEGEPAIHRLAKSHLEKLQNVECIESNINEILPKLVEMLQKVDFALIDANHTYDATVNYFNTLVPYIREESIIIIGDIYWSSDMTRAWNKIAHHPQVTLSLDFFECGVLFFKKDLNKAHYILNY